MYTPKSIPAVSAPAHTHNISTGKTLFQMRVLGFAQTTTAPRTDRAPPYEPLRCTNFADPTCSVGSPLLGSTPASKPPCTNQRVFLLLCA